MSFLAKFIALILVSPILAGQRCYTRPEVKQISKGHNAFARDFYLNVANQTEGNIFFSPFSIATCFALVHMGSQENTENELQNVFHYPTDKKTIRTGYNDLMTEFSSGTENYTLKSSNKIFIKHDLALLDNFTSSVTNDFLSAAENVDFSQHETIRQNINSYVEQETNSKIRNLLPKGSISESTALVLVNAIYFKGSWDKEFKKEDTKNRTFWHSNEESVQVSMMKKKGSFYYKENSELDAKILKLTYKGDACSFVMILPNKRDGLEELETKLANVSLESLDDIERKSYVEVQMPKFKIEQPLELKDNLKQLGLRDAFDDGKADFSGITGGKHLHISAAYHKAFVEVNEEGTEAAAASAITMVFKSAVIRGDPYHFIADHPFLFYIKHGRSQSVLFLGRYVKKP